MKRVRDTIEGIGRDYLKLVPTVLKYLNDLATRTEPLLGPLSIQYVATKDARLGDLATQLYERLSDFRTLANTMVDDTDITEQQVKEFRNSYPALFRDLQTFNFENEQVVLNASFSEVAPITEAKKENEGTPPAASSSAA